VFLVPVALGLVFAPLACDDPAGPAIPAESWLLQVRNLVEQTDNLIEQAVEFTAVLDGDVSELDLSRIQQVHVTWPNGIVRTPILAPFETVDDELRASRIIPQYPELVVGRYVLTVVFLDGQEITVGRDYPGETMSAPQILDFQADAGSVSIRWRAPSPDHTWRFHLERRDPPPLEVLIDGNQGQGGPGATISAGLDYPFEAGPLYVVVLEFESTYNRRILNLPFSFESGS
jgi:hypothetical protein